MEYHNSYVITVPFGSMVEFHDRDGFSVCKSILWGANRENGAGALLGMETEKMLSDISYTVSVE